MPNKKVTITDLARIIQRGFKEMAKKADMDRQFGEVNQKFGEVNQRFEGVNQRFGEINQKLANLGSDVSYLKSRILEIGRTLNHHEELLEEHSAELKWIHKKIDEFTDPRSEKRMITHKEYVELETRVATLEKKVFVKNH